MRTRRLATLAVTVLAVLPASAEAKSSEGPVRYTTGLNCSSVIYNNPRYEQQTFSFPSQLVPDDDSVPSGDQPFYVGVTFGSVGGNCGGGGHALPEFIPPVGVDVIEDPSVASPFWTLYQDSKTSRGGDPVVLSRGRFGGVVASVRDQSDGEVKPWVYANSGGFITVYVPMRTRRKLQGIGSPPPTCPAYQDSAGPCAREDVGDYLQVHNDIADGGSPSQLVTSVGLFATEPTPPASPPTGGPQPSPSSPPAGSPLPGSKPTSTPAATPVTISVARSVHASVARRGIAIRVTGAGPGSTVTATLTRKGAQRVARLSTTASAAGVAMLRPRVTPTQAARVRRAGGRLTLTVTVGARKIVRTIRLT